MAEDTWWPISRSSDLYSMQTWNHICILPPPERENKNKLECLSHMDALDSISRTGETISTNLGRREHRKLLIENDWEKLVHINNKIASWFEYTYFLRTQLSWFLFLFIFLRQAFRTWTAWNSLWRVGWPWAPWVVPLPLSPKCWYYRNATPYPAFMCVLKPLK